MAIVTPGTFSMAALASELQADPKGLGYAALQGNAYDIAVLINTTPEPIAAGQQEQIYRLKTPSADLMAGIVLSEWENDTNMPQKRREYCMMLFSAQFVNTGDANVRTQVGSIFGAGTTSRTNLQNAAQKNASRAEALWGDGFRVTDHQVYDALYPEGA